MRAKMGTNWEMGVAYNTIERPEMKKVNTGEIKDTKNKKHCWRDRKKKHNERGGTMLHLIFPVRSQLGVNITRV